MTADDAGEGPGIARFAAASHATYTGERTERLGDWYLRFAHGAGSRPSSTWAAGDPGMDLDAAIDRVETAYRTEGLAPRFQLWPGDEALDAALERRGYLAYDESRLLYRAVSPELPPSPGEVMAIQVRTPLAMLDEIWLADGLKPARRAVFSRAPEPKGFFLGRVGMRPCGAVVVLMHERIAIVNALYVLEEHRRQGLALELMRVSARFAADHGADWIAFSVTATNTPALTLYGRLGFQDFGAYHYRVLEEPR